MKNDGYDNEDSDYILYVNDILGSEEAGHKYVLLFHGTSVSKLTTARLRNLEIAISFSMCWDKVPLAKL